MINNKERQCSFLKKKKENWCLRCLGCLEASTLTSRPLDREPLSWLTNPASFQPFKFIFSRALLFEHLEQAGKLPDPLFFGKNEMNCMCNYLGHCLFLFCLFLSPYRYRRTLSLSLPWSPPSATSLLLPPCHHHYNYRYIVTKQPMIIFPQTENQIRKSSTLVILS